MSRETHLSDVSNTTVGSQPDHIAERNTPASGWSGKFRLTSKTVNQFMDDDCTTMAAAVAYYTTFSIAPLLLVVISIVGVVFGRQAVQHDIQQQIQGLIGRGPASQVGHMIQNAGQNSSTGFIGVVVGIIVLLF